MSLCNQPPPTYKISFPPPTPPNPLSPSSHTARFSTNKYHFPINQLISYSNQPNSSPTPITTIMSSYLVRISSSGTVRNRYVLVQLKPYSASDGSISSCPSGHQGAKCKRSLHDAMLAGLKHKATEENATTGWGWGVDTKLWESSTGSDSDTETELSPDDSISQCYVSQPSPTYVEDSEDESMAMVPYLRGGAEY